MPGKYCAFVTKPQFFHTNPAESVFCDCCRTLTCVLPARSITMNLCRDVYDLWRVAELYAEHGLPSAPRRRLLPELRGRSLALLFDRHRDLAVDTVKNVCDIVLPLSALGHLPLSPGGVGVCGVVSSALALWTVMDPSLVLRPS